MNQDHFDWEKELDEAPLGMGGFSHESIKQIKERVVMPSTKKRKLQPIVAAILAVSLIGSGWLFQDSITGWFNNDTSTSELKAPIWDQEEVTLSVQYVDKFNFIEQIGRGFIIDHPKVEFDVPLEPISYELEVYKQWLEDNNPDLIQIPLGLIDDLAAEGLIKPLDSWIHRDQFSLDEYYEPVIRTIREAGAGSMYGLPYQFDTYALYYNKSLFKQFGVDPPSDQMSWMDVLTLASRFKGTDAEGKPIYGIDSPWASSPFTFIQNIGQIDGLNIASTNDLKPTLDTEGWKTVWDRVIPGFRDGWISDEYFTIPQGHFLLKDKYQVDPFLNGRSAMTLMPSYYEWILKNAKEVVGFTVDWDIVTQPVSPSHPDIASHLTVNYIYAIHAKSPNAEAAWALLQHIVGPDADKQNNQLNYSRLLARLPTIGSESPHQDGIYYKLDVDSSAVIEQSNQSYDVTYQQFRAKLQVAGDEEVRAIVAGTHTTEQALKALQQVAENVAEQVKAGARENHS
ncbi:MAG: extracellular solute-binding protein [Candidatus Cohnella colombiensis]|uniref:Extracellular solute-binding protein n=1 Tax=Candidatus Cohnella colombiensis TaxID=3121368 RepID=A0AA95EWR3_9BACL|nr:MAG: extracellular solute-binding protein [Cohnella sp.]